MKKRIWAGLLALCLLWTALPAYAAEGDPSEIYTYGEEENLPGDLPDDESESDASEKQRPELETEEHIVYIHGSNDMVHPGAGLTRAEAAKIIYSLLKNPPAQVESGLFTDVAANAWYRTEVEALAAMDLLHGYGDGRFGPERPITRAEFVTILTDCFEPVETDLPFTDVEGHWAYGSIQTAVANGWLNGYSDGTVRPNAQITRAEAFAIVNRALGRSGDKAALKSQGVLRFLDLNPDHWAYADIMEGALPHDHKIGEDGKETWTSFEVPAASRAPGYYSINGELYCVDSSRHYVHDSSIGVLEFDSFGRYTTGNAQLDAKLTAIVRSNTAQGDTSYNNLRRLYIFVMNNYCYRANSFLADGATGWEAARALPMIQTGKGNCYDYAALFAMLARKLGYQAIGRSGWIRTSSWSWDEHGWTEISLDGQTYLCDPEFQGVYVWNHGLNWDLFMKQYGSTPTLYRVAGRVLG